MNHTEPVLEVRKLKTHFFTRDGVVKAVDDVNFTVHRGEVLGLVGESGCGKSVTALSILRLIGGSGKIVGGQILFQGEDICQKDESALTALRGNRISMIFQQPQTALNPVFRVGDQIAEVLEIHQSLKKEAARKKVLALLQSVGISDPERRAQAYPHELSGGMLQRVMIAMALACQPELLIADEPTTALDVTIQAQILDLMRNLRDEFGTAIIFITHDLGVVAEMCDHVAVMYAGQVVEQAPVRELFTDPQHPYTQGLLDSLPVLGAHKERLAVIPGSVPNLLNLPPGCRFAPRCAARAAHNLTRCTQEVPPFTHATPTHSVRCWLYPAETAPVGETP